MPTLPQSVAEAAKAFFNNTQPGMVQPLYLALDRECLKHGVEFGRVVKNPAVWRAVNGASKSGAAAAMAVRVWGAFAAACETAGGALAAGLSGAASSGLEPPGRV
jgi:hypothetical protein